MPGDTPKVLCFVARALSSGPGIISPPSHGSLRVLLLVARTGRKLAGGGTPTLRIQGDEVTFQTFSTPGAEQLWGIGNLVSLKLGLCGSGYCGFISRGQAVQVQGGAHLLAHSPQVPWPRSRPVLGPGLLSLHAGDTSPAPRGLSWEEFTICVGVRCITDWRSGTCAPGISFHILFPKEFITEGWVQCPAHTVGAYWIST